MFFLFVCKDMNSNIENAHMSAHMSESMSDSMSDSDSEIMNEIMKEIMKEIHNWEPLTGFEDIYEIEIEPHHREIETEPPHRIRRIRDGSMITISQCKSTGYYQLSLNGKTYPYHRILATHFIPNPNNLPEVDHINKDKTDNRISNLRWVNRSDNLRNRSQYKKQKTESLNHAPEDIIRITEFNGFEFQPCKYYFCFKNNRVIQRVNTSKWRWLAQTPNQGTLRVIMRDVNGQNHQVNMTKLINRFSWSQDNKQTKVKNYKIEELKALTNPQILSPGQYRLWRKLQIEMAKVFDV